MYFYFYFVCVMCSMLDEIISNGIFSDFSTNYTVKVVNYTLFYLFGKMVVFGPFVLLSCAFAF